LENIYACSFNRYQCPVKDLHAFTKENFTTIPVKDIHRQIEEALKIPFYWFVETFIGFPMDLESEQHLIPTYSSDIKSFTYLLKIFTDNSDSSLMKQVEACLKTGAN
jgi:hypothetical protein